MVIKAEPDLQDTIEGSCVAKRLLFQFLLFGFVFFGIN